MCVGSFAERPAIAAISRGVVLAILLLWAPPVAASAAWKDNECVKCHEAERLPISLGHSFLEWHSSSHAHVGVGCEKCHGGDTSLTDPALAHEGVLSASNPASMVHQDHLAATCGSCHQDQFDAYSQTVHAEQIRERHGAATCLTCHGSMATSLPSPSELRSRCAVCHDKPVRARVALSMLAAAKIQMFRTGRVLTAAKETDPEWHAAALKRFHKMERIFQDISLRWHKFAMDAVLEDATNLYKLAKLLKEELEIRAKLEYQRSE